MKVIQLVIGFFLLSYSATLGEPMEKADVWAEIHSILPEYHINFPSDRYWDYNQGTAVDSVGQSNVFSGSAVLVVDEPKSAPATCLALAKRICAGYRKLYDLGPGDFDGESDLHVIPVDPGGSPAVEAGFTWTNIAAPQTEFGNFRVEVVPLRNAKIGIFLTLVHLTPKSKPRP